MPRPRRITDYPGVHVTTRATDTPQTYHARPVQAMRLTPDNLQAAARWCGGAIHSEDRPNGGQYLLVPHLDGPLQAHPNKWLVQDGQGRYGTMTDDDFHGVYQANPPRPQGPITRQVDGHGHFPDPLS